MRYEDRRELAVKAVNRLIADATAGRVVFFGQNKELAEAIAACIRETASPQLQTLKSLIIRGLCSSISRLALLHFTYERLIFRVVCNV